MIYALLAVSVALLLAAGWVALRSRRSQKLSGLPKGRLIYADTGQWSEVAQPYFSKQHRLTGKPDYLVDTGDGLVPVEVKHTAAPQGGQAYESHVMQLAAYCLLVEESHGNRPPYGLIRYVDATVQIEYTPALRQHVLDLLEDMRASCKLQEVKRSHGDRTRCRACGVQHACGRHSLV
jgi:CRISPR-associated exonuclease Cas4